MSTLELQSCLLERCENEYFPSLRISMTKRNSSLKRSMSGPASHHAMRMSHLIWKSQWSKRTTQRSLDIKRCAEFGKVSSICILWGCAIFLNSNYSISYNTRVCRYVQVVLPPRRFGLASGSSS